ncbi:MAG: hypothetical protein L7F77_16160 [Candidatus Magnetominusculus sp. LBB02]|nr:hypothetical protein [Candidatus Magnetominusculus sp. LBB02]
MNDGYYVDVVTKNILSALSEHISDAISDQLIGVVKKTAAQLESKLTSMLEGAGSGVNAEQIEAIAKTVEGGLASIVSEIKTSLGENNKEQMASLKAEIAGMGAKIGQIEATLVKPLLSIHDKISSLDAEFKTMERHLSSAKADQTEIIRMMLEAELRNAEAMAERVHGSKVEIEERLKRLNGFIETSKEGR